MDLEIGIVCGRCESYAAFGVATCSSCEYPLALGARAGSGEPAISSPPPTTRDLSALGASAVRDVENALEEGLRRRQSAGRPPTLLRAIAGSSSAANHHHPRPRDRFGFSARRAGEVVVVEAEESQLEELMDQAKNFVCRSCSTPVPVGHKFLRTLRRRRPARDHERAHPVLRTASGAGQRRS